MNMAKKQPYEEAEITLDEAKERLANAENEFNGLESKYTKGPRRLQFWL